MKKILAASLLVACSSAFADDTTVAAKVSTLGLGVDLAIPMTQSIDGRIGFNTFNYNFNRSVASAAGGLPTNYTGKLNLQSIAALADYHPFDGGFRLTGGLLYNNNKFSMSAINANLNGVPCNCTASATIDFNKAAPYLGIGWGSAAKDSGLSFAADIGVLFQGSPKGTITTSGAAVPAADINQATADLNNSLKNFRYYPVVSIGIGYTF